jgi:predicted nucleotidyltransferase
MNASLTLPTILPLFRSEVQFRVLGETFTNPGLELAIGELADRIGHARPTVSHEVARLIEAGLLSSRREGNRTLVTAALGTPFSADLRSLLAKAYGPIPAIKDRFSDLPVTYVAVFGSWAARWSGAPGPPPNDIDLLVVGDASYEQVWEAVADLSTQLGIEVNPVLRSPDGWAADDSPFANEVRDGPLVPVIGGSTA